MEAERVASRGVGVSREGQDIFDALARMWVFFSFLFFL